MAFQAFLGVARTAQIISRLYDIAKNKWYKPMFRPSDLTPKDTIIKITGYDPTTGLDEAERGIARSFVIGNIDYITAIILHNDTLQLASNLPDDINDDIPPELSFVDLPKHPSFWTLAFAEYFALLGFDQNEIIKPSAIMASIASFIQVSRSFMSGIAWGHPIKNYIAILKKMIRIDEPTYGSEEEQEEIIEVNDVLAKLNVQEKNGELIVTDREGNSIEILGYVPLPEDFDSEKITLGVF